MLRSTLTMRKHCRSLPLAIALAVAVLAPRAAQAISFADIEFWVGEGTNQAALVLDWKDGSFTTSAYAWGYRWEDGVSPSAQDMLYAIAGPIEIRDPSLPTHPVIETLSGADPRLGLEMMRYGIFGDALYGMGYDIDDDGGFTYDYVSGGPADPDDLYTEGWDTGFMNYSIGNGPDTDSVTWLPSFLGMADTLLANNDWHGFVWDPGFTMEAVPSEVILPAPAPAGTDIIPEPATSLLVVVSALALARRRKRSA
jgi:hypothetical protein